jgi:hypothetical protein
MFHRLENRGKASPVGCWTSLYATLLSVALQTSCESQSTIFAPLHNPSFLGHRWPESLTASTLTMVIPKDLNTRLSMGTQNSSRFCAPDLAETPRVQKRLFADKFGRGAHHRTFWHKFAQLFSVFIDHHFQP